MTKITPEVRALVEESGVENGLVYVITEHTTTGITVDESLDYVKKGIMECLSRTAPGDYSYHHNHCLPTYGTIGGNTPGHLRSLLIGNHCVSPVVWEELKLGHAADIHFCEYDEIKMRHHMVYAVGERKEQNMKRAITVAGNCTDVYYKPDQYYLTGNSIDFVFNYRGLDGGMTEMTILGNDVFATALKERPKKRGVALRVLKRAGRPTGTTAMDIMGGDKKHSHFEENVMGEVELPGEDPEFVKSFDIVYVERWSRIDRYIKELEQSGQIWMYDFSKRLKQGGDDLILPYLDYAFFSYDRGDGYIRDFMVEVRKKGTGTVITMLEEYGSLAYDEDWLYEKETEKVPVVNTVGTGGSYIAAFTYGVSLGGFISQCMDRGKKRATEIIRQFNPYR